MWVQIEKETIWENNTAHFLGMTIHYDLKFGKNLSELCKRVNWNINWQQSDSNPQLLSS